MFIPEKKIDLMDEINLYLHNTRTFLKCLIMYICLLVGGFIIDILIYIIVPYDIRAPCII